MTINQLLRQRRKEKGLTVSELGRIIIASDATITAWECARRNPSADTLRKYVQAGLITPVEALGLDGDDSRGSNESH